MAQQSACTEEKACQVGKKVPRLRVRNLAVQVVQGHGVLVDDAEAPNARGREVERARAAEAARADNECRRRAEARLRCSTLACTCELRLIPGLMRVGATK